MVIISTKGYTIITAAIHFGPSNEDAHGLLLYIYTKEIQLLISISFKLGSN
jgi:hypothetical protein